jgi:hypothetical protein
VELNGGGGLSAQAYGVHKLQSVSLSGSGALSAQVFARRFRDGEFSGGGELDAAALGPTFRSVEFSSEGIVSAAALGPRFVDVEFGGNGEYFATVQAPHFVDVEFNGQGLLGAAAEGSAPLPDGLSASVSQQYTVLAEFTSDGSLSIALSEIEHALGPSFTGVGELSAAVMQIQHVTANFSGDGQVQAIAGHLAALAGSGTLSAEAFELLVALRDASLSGGGTIAATTGGERYRPNANAGGSGSMSATAFERYFANANLGGDGSLSASAVAQVLWHATGDGFNYNSNAKTDSGSFNTNCSTGDYVIAFISGDDDSSPTVQLGGSNMTQLAVVPFNNNSSNAQLEVYGRQATGNNQTLNWTGNAPGSVLLQSVSYNSFGSVGPVSTAYGSGSLASHSVSCNVGEMIVQAFAADQATWTPGGGTARSSTSDSTNDALLIQDSTQTANFTASGTIGNWASVAVILRST